MDKTRRNLIKAGAVIVPAIGLAPAFFGKEFIKSLLAAAINTDHILIIIQLAGGVDGLNVVVPYNDPRYYQYRPNIAISKNQVVPLTNDIGLNPSLSKLKAFWDQGMLAIVQGIGYPNPNYSHFASMHKWQTGDPVGNLFNDGWLGRYLATLGTNLSTDFPGIAVNSNLPFELYSAKVSVPVVSSIAGYQIQSDTNYPDKSSQRLKDVVDLFDAAPKTASFTGQLDSMTQLAQKSVQALSQADHSYVAGATYPNNSFGSSLRLLSEAIVGNLGLRLGHVTLGGFDTHSNEDATLTTQLTILADGISAFYQDLKVHGLDK